MKLFKLLPIIVALCILNCSCRYNDIDSNNDSVAEFSYDGEVTSNVETSVVDQQELELKTAEINSLSNPKLQMRFHENSDILEPYIEAMSANPVDCEFSNDIKNVDTENEFFSLIKDKYIALWETEIAKATDDLCALIGEDSREIINEYIQVSIESSNKRMETEKMIFTNVDSEVYLGQYAKYGIYDTFMDSYRQLLFELKYLAYIAELSNNQAGKSSLKFLNETANNSSIELSTVFSNTAVIETTLSPSYTEDDASEFINAVKHDLKVLTLNGADDSFVNELQSAINAISLHIDYDVPLEDYCETALDKIEKANELYLLLSEKGILPDNGFESLESIKNTSKFELVSLLKYWEYVIQTEIQ